MGQVNITEERLEMTAVDRGAAAAIEKVVGGTKALRSEIDAIGGSMRALGAAVGIGTIVAIGKQALDAAQQAEQSHNRLQAVIRATGSQAGLTTDQLDEMAEALSRSTQFDDDGIRNAQAQLLKFGNIHGQVFTGALKLSADLAAFMGTNVPEAAQMIGRSLQSPTQGLQLMERQFGKLTEAEQNHIKTLAEQGRAVEAQNAVLELWQRKVGGTAEAMNTGLTKATRDAGKAWDDFLKSLGQTPTIGGAAERSLSGIAKVLRELESIVKGGGPLAAMTDALKDAEQELQRLEAKAAPLPSVKSVPGESRMYDLYAQGGAARSPFPTATPLSEDQLAARRAQRISELRAQIDTTRQILEAAQSKAVDIHAFDPKSLDVTLGGGDSTGKNGKTAADILNELAGVSKDFTEDLMKLHAEYAAGRLKLNEYREAVERLTQKQEFARKLDQERKEQTKEVVASAQKLLEQDERRGEAFAKANETLSAYIQAQQFELEIMGLSDLERQRLTEFRRIDLQVTELSTDATEEQIEAIKRWGEEAKKAYGDALDAKTALADQDARIKAALDENRRLMDERQRMADTVQSALANATANGLMQGFQKGAGFAENFARSFSSAFETALSSAVITPIISPMFAPVSGMMAGIGQGIAGSIWGKAGAGASTAFALPGWLTGMFGGGAAAAGPELLAGPALEGAAAGAASSGMFGGAMAGIAAIPGIGWIAAAAIMASTPQGRAMLATPHNMMGQYIDRKTNTFMDPIGAYMAGEDPMNILKKTADPLGLFTKWDDGDAARKGNFVGGFGELTASTSNQWFSGDEMGGALNAFSTAQQTREQNLIRNLALTPDQVAAVNASLGGIAGREYNFGVEHTPVEQSGAFEQIAAARLQAMSDALGRSIEELSQVMSLSAEQWQEALDQLHDTLEAGEDQLARFARSLPETLGITALEDYKGSLSMSETLSPFDRLAGARTQYDDLLGRALGGDLDAVRSFPRAAQDLLGIGRDVYASGSGFQDLFREVNLSLGQVLEQQRATQADLMTGIQGTMTELAQREIEELRRTKDAMVEAVNQVRTELQRMQAA